MKNKLYKIGDITRKLKITPRTIRYYDQIGLLPNIKRSDGDTRLFDDNDLNIITQIRKLQKAEYLPLDHIKDQLYKDNLIEKETLFFSDSNSTSVLNFSKDLTCCPIAASPSKSDSKKIYDFILAQHKNGKKVFIAFYHEDFDIIYQTVKKELPKAITLALFSFQAKGVTPYITLKTTMSLAARCGTLTELKHIVSRFQELSFNICVLDGLEYFFKPLPASPKVSPMILPYYPLLFSNESESKVTAFLEKKNPCLETIFELFETTFMKQKRYCEHVHIFESNQSSLAKSLHKKLLKHFPKLPVKVESLPNLTELGKKYCIISII